ncbi:XrtA system polysaccharide chain length determinant [Desulfovibrio sp. Fe33]|uniref:XrtA system polysaccharide chain length determinant n=1 Tax=Desulfovibrio sp. Fe33 TaxID=3020842 RepID=UPI00234DA413|nr:XrtA system polysaccharide chain length determinant [Desulfovibrio sp. Fe33]
MADNKYDIAGQDASFDAMRYLRMVGERKTLFVSIALLIMFAAVVISYMLPRKYEARSIVFIEQNVISDLVKGIAVTPSMDTKIKAIKVTMLSRNMLSQVIKALDLDVSLKNNISLDEMIKSLRGRIAIGLDEKRGVFDIRFADSNPVLARDVVNTLTRVYIEESVSTKRKESFEATRFLADQIDVFKKRIDEARKEIEDFNIASGKVLASNEYVVRNQIEKAQEQIKEIQIQINALEASRKVLLSNSPARARLREQEQVRNQMLARYTESHPRVKQLESAIAETRRQIREEGNDELSIIYSSPEYQNVKVHIQALETQKKNLEEDIAQNKAILDQIPRAQAQLQELKRKEQNEVIIYEKLVSRYGQSEVSKEMELQDKAVSFRVLDPAVIPTIPSSPNRPLIMLAGIAIGFGVAFGVVFLLDIIDPSIKNVDDLREFGIPVLAVIPKLKNVEEERKASRRSLRIYLIGAVGLLIVLAFLGMEFLGIGLVDKVIEKSMAVVRQWRM